MLCRKCSKGDRARLAAARPGAVEGKVAGAAARSSAWTPCPALRANPVAAGRGPKHVVTKGATPVLTPSGQYRNGGRGASRATTVALEKQMTDYT